jgi:hypothetical protein
MFETVSTALMGTLVVVGGLYGALRWIVLAGVTESGGPAE